VDWLEDRYPGFRGLNLSHETREGILKHGCSWEHPVPVPALASCPSLEAQLADHADEIAYLHHDLDDGLRSGLIRLEQLAAVALWSEARATAEKRVGGASGRVLRSQVLVVLINRLVTDLLEASAARLVGEALGSAAAVRARKDPVVGFSREMQPRKE